MPLQNHFRHQHYSAKPPAVTPVFFPAGLPVENISSESGQSHAQERIAEFAPLFHGAGVATLFLVHGTFVGDDGLGWWKNLARVWPAAGEILKRQSKSLVDFFIQDGGNYTEAFARDLATGLNSDKAENDSRSVVSVQLFNWSSENTHTGRAEAAVRLLDTLATSATAAPGKRILLWGHSHAGNVFALVTNLLGAMPAVRERFFTAARTLYKHPIKRNIDAPEWPRVETILNDASHPLRHTPLDFVTFGTPIRYGWDTAGYSKLLHLVSHAPTDGYPQHQAPFPPSADDLLHAAHGDIVQQMGIAGTNLFPNLFDFREVLAESRLHRLLQADLEPRELLARLRLGVRVADEGTTLLINYGPMTGHVAHHLAGHAVYTRREWLPFHVEVVGRRLYAEL